ncbi:hypothetical protein L596_010393 [Steinernema carpocapsae]|uniref:Uncharacterized protein n=1 Tax=Steinernema carpocapsae TaxID=34508 RepID=A0A4U5PI84_STECR|nr:hypothetical protein L596_010393 [Steinernema carpocapsae]
MYVPCNAKELIKTEYGDAWREDYNSDNWSYRNNPKNIIEIKTLSNATFDSRVKYVNENAERLSAEDK